LIIAALMTLLYFKEDSCQCSSKSKCAAFGEFGENPVIFPTLTYAVFITTGHFLTLGGIRLDGAISPLDGLGGWYSSGMV